MQVLRPLFQPGEKIVVHRLPRDIAPATSVSLELGGVEGQLLDLEGFVVQPLRKQPKQARLTRFTKVELEFGQQVIAQELQVNLTTAEVFVIGQIHSPLALAPQILCPLQSTLSTYYKRKNKPKLMHAYFHGPGHPSLSIEKVLGTYDRVFCVDTNTAVDRQGKVVAVTTALIAKATKMGEIASHVSSDFCFQVIARDPPPGNPELHGMWSVLEYLVKNHPEHVQGRLSIITDTEFSNIKAWQDRTQPFYNGHHLPEGVDIFYATSDAGSEEFNPNLLMRKCDSLSAAKLKQVLAS
jgi:hypothetical protein